MGTHHRPFRVVVLGSTGAGKTALIQHLVFGNYDILEKQEQKPSESDVYEICVATERGYMEKLQVFDTPGHLFDRSSSSAVVELTQEHFLTIADGFILVFSITSKPSYSQVVSLWQRIALRSKDIPVVAVGMKADLTAHRAVEKEAVFSYSRSRYGEYFECTVVDRTSLISPFVYITTKLSLGGKLATSTLSLVPPPTPSRGSREGSSVDLVSTDSGDVADLREPVTASCIPQASSLLSCLRTTTKK